MKILDQKENDILDFWNALRVMFLDYQKYDFEGVLVFFFDKVTPYFDCMKADDF